jgi:nucleoside-diphosphate-sugar epimerase
MKIAVTGAFSYTGKYITRRLLAQGHEVITLTGHPNRPDPFGGKVKAFPLDFDEAGMSKTLAGVDTLYNTYWIRFDQGKNTQPQAVKNTQTLVKAAKAADVRRMVHISIANPSAESHLPYYWGKAANEKAVIESGMRYAILRPTVLYGAHGGEDVLINNIAWLLRHFPFFGQIGNGQYKIQPVHVDDLAALAVEAGERDDNLIWDAVGPDIFTFDGMVRLIGEKIGAPKPILHLPPGLALMASCLVGLVVKDVVLTPEEVEGLMTNLLVSSEPPRTQTHLADWLTANRDTVGVTYASEIQRHYQ